MSLNRVIKSACLFKPVKRSPTTIGNFTHNKSVRIKLSSAGSIAFADSDEYTLREAMGRQYISDELKTFIKDQIQTVFRLEVLLLLHGKQGKSFTPADVALEL